MKKLIRTTVAISLITMVLVGCGTDSVENTSNNIDAENMNSVPIQAVDTDTDNNISDEVEWILYENDNIGFSMQIPLSWEGKYSAVEREETNEDGTISYWVEFYHNATIEDLGPDVGFLFSFANQPGYESEREVTLAESGKRKIITEQGGYTYYITFPTGIEYNYEDPESESAIEYNEMESQVDFLIDTFKVIEK